MCEGAAMSRRRSSGLAPRAPSLDRMGRPGARQPLLYWLKAGDWLPLPLSVIGVESWKGLAKLPLSLGAFVAGLIACRIAVLLYPAEKTESG